MPSPNGGHCTTCTCKMVCIVTGCDKPAVTREMCSKHYSRWWRYGDPYHVAPRLSVKSYGPPKPDDLDIRTDDGFWDMVKANQEKRFRDRL